MNPSPQSMSSAGIINAMVLIMWFCADPWMLFQRETIIWEFWFAFIINENTKRSQKSGLVIKKLCLLTIYFCFKTRILNLSYPSRCFRLVDLIQIKQGFIFFTEPAPDWSISYQQLWLVQKSLRNSVQKWRWSSVYMSGSTAAGTHVNTVAKVSSSHIPQIYIHT